MTGILTLYSGGTSTTKSNITFSKYQTGTKILQQGDDLGDFTITLPGEDGTLATQEWATRKPLRYSGTVASDGYLHVEHNLNISGNMYPVVVYAVTGSSANACVIYGVRYQNANRFDVGIMLANGYQLTSAIGKYVDINWTY